MGVTFLVQRAARIEKRPPADDPGHRREPEPPTLPQPERAEAHVREHRPDQEQDQNPGSPLLENVGHGITGWTYSTTFWRRDWPAANSIPAAIEKTLPDQPEASISQDDSLSSSRSWSQE